MFTFFFYILTSTVTVTNPQFYLVQKKKRFTQHTCFVKVNTNRAGSPKKRT